MTTLDTIVMCLSDHYFTVYTRPQEKLQYTDIQCMISDLKLSLESIAPTYVFEVEVALEFIANDQNDMLTRIVSVVNTLTPVIQQPTFKFRGIGISLTGTEYRIQLLCSYKEVIRNE